MRKMKKNYSAMCINSILALLTWVFTIALVAPLATVSATIRTAYRYKPGKK